MWNSGYLEIGKGNRRRLITHKDIQKILKLSISGTTSIISRMKKHGLLQHDGVGYRLKSCYFAKGVVPDED